MNRFDALKRWTWSVFIIGFLAFAFAGCEGDTGPQGPPGADGQDGQDGQDGLPGVGIDPDDPATAVAAAKVESCGTCHSGVGTTAHQSVYDSYTDPSTLALTINSVTSSTVVGVPGWTVTVEFTITDLTNPNFDAGDNLALFAEGQRRFLAVQYNSATGEYLNDATLFSVSGNGTVTGNIVSNGNGTYTLTRTGFTYAPEMPALPFDGAQVYGYVARGALFEHEGGTGAEIPEGSHVHLYEDVANAAFPIGTAVGGVAGAYVSAANVGGCQKCHGTPYLKHGYRAATVAGIPDFAACKSCHEDARPGGHEDWQYMVDDPLNWATNGLPAATVEAKYAYTANIMNDTHMSHAMEFPYPQSMQNCATCHGPLFDASGVEIPGTNKLAQVLDNSNFTGETCLSCHPLEGTNARPGDDYYQGNRAPALGYLWTRGADLSFHQITATCTSCHGTNTARSLTAYHTGYDVNITNAAGERYSDLYTVAIDAITYDSVTGLITVEFSTSDPAIVPELLISFYGYDSKNFYVPAHERDANPVCEGFRPGCNMEYVPESTGATGTPKPMFTEDAASAPPDYKVVVDPSLWQLTKTDLIPQLIADNKVRRIEVTVTGELNLSNLATPGPDVDVVLTAANATFDLNLGVVLNDYFKGPKATVSTAKCNVCHDALASSFHSESGRAGDGIEVCKNCHNVNYGGGHWEMTSRSIDSYVHAIHSFQGGDVGDDFSEELQDRTVVARFDPVLAKRYDMHLDHVFPNFTIRNCEACHVTAGASDGAGGTFPVVYNVPDQSQSMPSLLSSSDDNVLTWYEIVRTPSGSIPSDIAVEDPLGRNIGSVPSYITGAASRACGGCHRARLVKDDAAGALGSFNAHTEAGGTLIDATNDTNEKLYGVIDKIMSLFE